MLTGGSLTGGSGSGNSSSLILSNVDTDAAQIQINYPSGGYAYIYISEALESGIHHQYAKFGVNGWQLIFEYNYPFGGDATHLIDEAYLQVPHAANAFLAAYIGWTASPINEMMGAAILVKQEDGSYHWQDQGDDRQIDFNNLGGSDWEAIIHTPDADARFTYTGDITAGDVTWAFHSISGTLGDDNTTFTSKLWSNNGATAHRLFGCGLWQWNGRYDAYFSTSSINFLWGDGSSYAAFGDPNNSTPSDTGYINLGRFAFGTGYFESTYIFNKNTNKSSKPAHVIAVNDTWHWRADGTNTIDGPQFIAGVAATSILYGYGVATISGETGLILTTGDTEVQIGTGGTPKDLHVSGDLIVDGTSPGGGTDYSPKRAKIFADEININTASTWSRTGDSGTYATGSQDYHFYYTNNSSNADGDSVVFGCVLQANAAYRLSIFGQRNSAGGLVDIYLDPTLDDDGNITAGSPLAFSQIDFYNASQQKNVPFICDADFAIPTSGFHTFVIKVNGKNASSSGYVMYMTKINIYVNDGRA